MCSNEMWFIKQGMGRSGAWPVLTCDTTEAHSQKISEDLSSTSGYIITNANGKTKIPTANIY